MHRRHEDTDQSDDATLLTACLAGNQEAWSELVSRYTRLVYAIAFKSGLTEQDAADVVQNVFTIVLRRLESLQQADRFSAWLITTTHRESWRVKKSQREESLGSDIKLIDPDSAPDAQIVEWEQASLIHQALQRLDDRCKQLLELLFLGDARPGYKAIATELGISIGSIGPIRARCLKRLKDKLAEFGILDSDRQ